MKVKLVCLGHHLNNSGKLTQRWGEYLEHSRPPTVWSYKTTIRGAKAGQVWFFEMTSGDINGSHNIITKGKDGPEFAHMHPNAEYIAEWTLESRINYETHSAAKKADAMYKEHDVLTNLNVFRDRYARASIKERSAIIMVVIRYIMGGA